VAGRTSLSLHYSGKPAYLFRNPTEVHRQLTGILAWRVTYRFMYIPCFGHRSMTGSFMVSGEEDQTISHWGGEEIRLEQICPVQDDGQVLCMG
jgi:hypothetical protein